MRCPHCKDRIRIKELLAISNIKLFEAEPSKDNMVCPKCNKQIYFGFDNILLLAGAFIALLGLSKIGLFQMKYNFVLTSYVFLSVLCIAFLGMKLYSKPSDFELIKTSKAHLLNLIFYISLLVTSIYMVTAIYSNSIPNIKSLVEISGTVKSINIQNRMFNYIELNNDPYNMKYLIQDTFDSKAAHVGKNTKIQLLVEKYPNFTGDSYLVWEVKSGDEILLPYEDLSIIRKYKGKLGYTPLIKLLVIFLF
jgi:hypothetical protein